MMWDNHMHSSFSGDSDASPISMIEAAKALKLSGITFTDHLDIDYAEEPGLFDLDIVDYYSKQHSLAKSESTPDFSILTGIEVGLMPTIVEKNRAAISLAPFDVVIGSTHVVDGKDPYYESFWANEAPQRLLKRYYEVILENISAFDDFDTLGHLDYCFRYAPKSALNDINDTYTGYQEIIDAILQRLIKMDKALEVNTGSFKKGFTEPNPCSKIISRYRQLGGQLITIGADAHQPSHIALGFDRLALILKENGFNEFAVYKNRTPQLFPID